MICTPPRTHAAIIERAARAGKAVFCEKPVDLDLARVDACAKVLEATGTPFFVAFNRRFDPSHRALFDAIRAGDIGRPEMLVLSSRDPEISPPDYVAAMPYGIFYDTMIHDFDMVRWLLRRRAGRDRRAHRVHARRERESAPRSRHGDGDADDGERRAGARQFELSRGVRLRPADRGLRLEGHADLAQPPADRARALRRRTASAGIRCCGSSSSATRSRTRASSTTSFARSRQSARPRSASTTAGARWRSPRRPSRRPSRADRSRSRR